MALVLSRIPDIMKNGRLIILALFLGLCRPAGAADWDVIPALAVSEIYTDNLFNVEQGRTSEYITRLQPSLGFTYDDDRREVNLAYTFDYRYYARDRRDDETAHLLDANVLTDLWRQTLYLELIEEYRRVSLDAARDFTEESLFLRQSDRNLFSASPYLVLQPTPRNTVRTGYRFIDTRYSRREGVNRQDHIFFLEGEHELTARLTARAGYAFARQYADRLDFDRQDLWTGLEWEYLQDAVAFSRVGYSWFDFRDGRSNDYLFWDLGVTHDLQVLTATAATGVSYSEDPEGALFRRMTHRLTIRRELLRGEVVGSGHYSDFRNVETDRSETRAWGGRGDLIYELAPRWSSALALSWTRFQDRIEATRTRRIIGTASLTWLMAPDLTSTLSYSRIDSHSPQLRRDRYETNMGMLEVRKEF